MARSRAACMLESTRSTPAPTTDPTPNRHEATQCYVSRRALAGIAATMKDSSGTKQIPAAAPTERPSWRFSGRRGTPVHMRDQAPDTLPSEIRQAVARLANDRSEKAAVPATPPPARPATSLLNLARAAQQSPPVAGAPVPVERRTRQEPATPIVTTSPIVSVPTAPAAPEIVLALAMRLLKDPEFHDEVLEWYYAQEDDEEDEK